MNNKNSTFARRAAAYIVDLVAIYILVVTTMFISVMAFGLWQYSGDEKMLKAMMADPNTRIFAQLAHGILYFSYFTIAHWYFGRSIGKLFFGLKIHYRGQTELGFFHSLGRALAYTVSGQLTLGIGFMLPLFRQDGRTLHDIICNTDVRPLAPSTEAREKSPSVINSNVDAA